MRAEEGARGLSEKDARRACIGTKGQGRRGRRVCCCSIADEGPSSKAEPGRRGGRRGTHEGRRRPRGVRPRGEDVGEAPPEPERERDGARGRGIARAGAVAGRVAARRGVGAPGRRRRRGEAGRGRLLGAGGGVAGRARQSAGPRRRAEKELRNRAAGIRSKRRQGQQRCINQMVAIRH